LPDIDLPGCFQVEPPPVRKKSRKRRRIRKRRKKRKMKKRVEDSL
jgi:hypothetical protein